MAYLALKNKVDEYVLHAEALDGEGTDLATWLGMDDVARNMKLDFFRKQAANG